MIPPKPVFLTGFMGVGKTKIGGILASRLGRKFLDTDNLIEAREGKSISRIFSEDGEVSLDEVSETENQQDSELEAQENSENNDTSNSQ